jgi:hypothetical protein
MKLHDLCFNLKKVVNEFGASSLPYPRKDNTISDIIGWFDEEMKALPATFMKVNKIFACYAIIGVLQMLYDSGCGHLSELQTRMYSCDASLLKHLLPELSKLTGRLVWKWWVEHGLPEATRHLSACLFPAFHHFFISFQEIQKLDDPKSEKLEAPFHELLGFSLLRPSSFWISQNLIKK